MSKGKLENWSEKTKGIKVDGKWFNCTDFVLERAHQLGKGAEIEYQLNDENKENVWSISGKMDHEKAVKEVPQGRTDFNIVQVRESALKSAVASIGSMPEWNPEAVTNQAAKFERYLLSGSAGGD